VVVGELSTNGAGRQARGVDLGGDGGGQGEGEGDEAHDGSSGTEIRECFCREKLVEEEWVLMEQVARVMAVNDRISLRPITFLLAELGYTVVLFSRFMREGTRNIQVCFLASGLHLMLLVAN
jgi:hypothetical protein